MGSTLRPPSTLNLASFPKLLIFLFLFLFFLSYKILVRHFTPRKSISIAFLAQGRKANGQTHLITECELSP